MAKMNPQFFGRVKDGKLRVERPDEFRTHLESLEGKEVGISVKKAEYNRSSAENRYYWGGIVRMVGDEIGIIPDEAHDLLKGLFLKHGVEHEGKRFEITRSTASLSIGEFEDYCEQCRMWAANELHCRIPLPNEITID